MAVILTIDIGSSLTKWGLHDGQHWVLFNQTQDPTWLPQISLPLTPSIIVASNVGSAHLFDNVEPLAMQCERPLINVIPSDFGYGLYNEYDDPIKLGSDRWAALVATRQFYDGAYLVVDLGTAITLDYLDDQGHFKGGSILPGFSVMKTALVEQTANLTLDTGQWSSLPTNTANGITTGCIEATVGAIEKTFYRLKENDKTLKCVVTGGDALTLLPYFQIPVYHAEHLVHDGLRYIGDVQLSEALCESS